MSVLKVISGDCPVCGGDVYVVDSVDDEYGCTFLALCPRCMNGTPPCGSADHAIDQWKKYREELLSR